MASSICQVLANRPVLGSLGQGASRAQPIAFLGRALTGQCRHKATHSYIPRRGVKASRFKYAIKWGVERSNITAAKRETKDADQKKLETEDRFRTVGPEDHFDVIPLQEGEVGVDLPAVRAPWLDDPDMLLPQLKKPKVVKDIPTHTRIPKLRVLTTGYDKAAQERFCLDVQRYIAMLDCKCSPMLGLANQMQDVVIMKRVPSKNEVELKEISYELEMFSRYVDLLHFPTIYVDMLVMMARRDPPAGVNITLQFVQDASGYGANFMSKDMRDSASKMAKKAMKGSGKVRYTGL